MTLDYYKKLNFKTKMRLMLEYFGTDDGLKIMEYMTLIGYAPQLLYDDNGHWAVSLDGMQGGFDPPTELGVFTPSDLPWFERPQEAIWWVAIESDLRSKIKSTTKKAPTLELPRPDVIQGLSDNIKFDDGMDE